MIDPVRLAILARGLRAIADEMGINLVRSAFSTVVREARDCSTALLDAQGRVVAQAEMIPMQTAAVGRSFRHAAEQLDLSGVDERHAILLNDPFSGGQHLNDIIIFQPIMHGGELLGWAGNTAHHLDIGGGSAGVNTAATELIQEGLIIPPVLIDVERDWHGGTVERLIFANIRTAEIGLGDINAQFAANHVGRERVREMAEREGAATVRAAMEAALDYSERRMRAAIAEIPDGTYTGEAWIDRDVFDPNPIRVAATVTVTGDTIAIDFAGTAPQVRGMFNCPVSSATAAALTALRSVLTDKDIPANDGCNRPVELRFPEGSLLNPRPGAPVRARMAAAFRALDAVHGALAQALPQRVPAEGFNTTTGFYIAQPRGDGTFRVYVDVLGGGFGGATGYDGCHATDNILASCRNTPVESIEQVHPHLLMDGYALVEDSCGAGEFRGGLGFRRSIRVLEPGVFLNLYSDHYTLPPRGKAGGGDGGRGSLTVRRGGEVIALGATSSFPLEPGDIIDLAVGGGAGWGEPSRRDPASVRLDLADGLISPEFARTHYAGRLAAE
jgi:N-methylhydantoinase B